MQTPTPKWVIQVVTKSRNVCICVWPKDPELSPKDQSLYSALIRCVR